MIDFIYDINIAMKNVIKTATTPTFWNMIKEDIPDWIISVFFNIVIIFIMLLTLRATYNSAKSYIEEMKRWSDIRRKQMLKSLIEELRQNIIIYEMLIDDIEEKKYHQKFFNFGLVVTEKCLADTPLDNEDINHNILVIYYMIKIHDNKISATRTPNLSQESLNGFINTIASDYSKNKWIIEDTIQMLNDYEQKIKA